MPGSLHLGHKTGRSRQIKMTLQQQTHPLKIKYVKNDNYYRIYRSCEKKFKSFA